jgi:adenylate cyclase
MFTTKAREMLDNVMDMVFDNCYNEVSVWHYGGKKLNCYIT